MADDAQSKAGMVDRMQPLRMEYTPEVLTFKDLCIRLDVSRTTLWRWQKDGTFPPPDGKLGRRFIWTRQTYERWLAETFGWKGEVTDG
jgi:predicted DNA-binding transcriptional regulator AlpA